MKKLNLKNLCTIIKIINNDNEWVFVTKEKGKLFLDKDKSKYITNISKELLTFMERDNEITKYIESDENNNITYVCNLTSDIIPYNNGFVYLIERSDGSGWAIPGGFIDYGEEPIEAAVREFNEETLGTKKDIDDIKYIGLFKTNDKRDLNFFSFVFLFQLNNLHLKYNDDAINGKWVSIDDAINMNLAFRHHNEFLKLIKK